MDLATDQRKEFMWKGEHQGGEGYLDLHNELPVTALTLVLLEPEKRRHLQTS